ncbi:MAG: helix-turn-helix domain-containing protein [Bacilli bacterium]|nr:helix-turn-helix domain-containing protein [Bacilli bacterium]MDD4283100.1 helix-turn-helix domain-containing protein [Bacilli bacterium]MDD4718402.1 helix-turn-helix domain-containing protein [Bacilli bacterium]
MKEIGEKLREERLSIGISIEEAAEDLKMRPIQIENIEEGNMEAFQDIFYLKYFIRDYSKYLGLKYEEMVDEFNEFLFDYTSKISLDDIKEAQKKENKKEKSNKIASPYTLERRPRINITPLVIYIFIIILVITGLYFYFRNEQDEFNDNSIVINTIN